MDFPKNVYLDFISFVLVILVNEIKQDDHVEFFYSKIIDTFSKLYF